MQNPDRQLFADTVEEEIAFGSKNLKLPEAQIKERVEYAIEVTGLEAVRKLFPPSLSAGERAKTVIASVVAMRPDIIVLDVAHDRTGSPGLLSNHGDRQGFSWTWAYRDHGDP